MSCCIGFPSSSLSLPPKTALTGTGRQQRFSVPSASYSFCHQWYFHIACSDLVDLSQACQHDKTRLTTWGSREFAMSFDILTRVLRFFSGLYLFFPLRKLMRMVPSSPQSNFTSIHKKKSRFFIENEKSWSNLKKSRSKISKFFDLKNFKNFH